MPLLIFFWGSLTFPRPSKFFWVLLISYVKTVVVIKSLAQLDLVWWDREHVFVTFFGINRDENFALYDLILLLALFLHRAVLKMFGLWKEEDEPTFHEGTFELDRSDAKTKLLIRQTIVNRMKPKESVISQENPELVESNDLLMDESDKRTKKIHRHEFNEGKNEIETIYKENQLLTAMEEIYCDNQGHLAIKLQQETVKLRLRQINPHNTNKSYPIQRVVVLENEVENPYDYYPNIIRMAIQRYTSLTSNYLKGLFSHYRTPRQPVDMYTFMFFFEFVNFFVLVFGFSTFAVSSCRLLLAYL